MKKMKLFVYRLQADSGMYSAANGTLTVLADERENADTLAIGHAVGNNFVEANWGFDKCILIFETDKITENKILHSNFLLDDDNTARL